MKNTGPKAHIYKPDFYGKPYGGYLYDTRVIKALNNKYYFDWVNANVPNSKLITVFRFFRMLFESKFNRNPFIFLNFLSVPFFSFYSKHTIVLIHHIDWSRSPFFSKIYQIACYKIFIAFKYKWHKVIVVSRFWKEKLESLGFKNVEIIYNSIEPIDEDKILSKEAFLKKYDLQQNQNYIYLGNAQKAKGWVNAYEQLKNLDFFFIITGISDNIDFLPEKVKYLYLDATDYQALLKYAECTVLLSNFIEGWNSVAQESMLFKTPVIGSGKGGMQELLSGGNQIICTEMNQLVQLTNKAINNRTKLGEAGYNYVKQFNNDYFKKSWESVFK